MRVVGKTTIALHRIAYLIYNYEKEFKPEEFMIIAPNRFFLDYISSILPDLGVNDVKQYIDDTIRNLYEMDELLGINWKGKEGKDFIDKKCKECYELIQAFEEV